MHSIIFYDGDCALCHGFVLFVLRRDEHAFFHFAPLQGSTSKEMLDTPSTLGRPLSIIVRTPDDTTLSRSKAVFYVLQSLGGFWKAVANLLNILPRFITDLSYDLIASARYRVFGKSPNACPMVPAALSSRFLP